MWSAAQSGNWTDATKWDNGVPNNGTATYDAAIAAAGASAYTVTMNSAATVDSFTLNSPQATLDITKNGILQLAGSSPSQVLAGTLKFSGGTLQGGSIDLHGNTVTSTTTSTLSGVTVLSDFSLTGGKLVATNGTSFQGANLTLTDSWLTFNQNTVLDGKSVVFQRNTTGPTMVAGANTVLTLGAGTSLTTSQSSSQSIYLSGNTGSTIVNQGQISAPLVGIWPTNFTNSGRIQAGVLSLGEAWRNAAGGVIECDGTTPMDVDPSAFGFSADSQSTWQNDGRITIKGVPGYAVNLFGTWTNTGLIELNDLTSIAIGSAGTNAGTIAFTNCQITELLPRGNTKVVGGKWTPFSGDSTAAVDNSGNTLSIGGGCEVDLGVHPIVGGRLVVDGGITLTGRSYNSNCSLDGVGVQGDVTIKGWVGMKNGADLKGNVIFQLPIMFGPTNLLYYYGDASLSGCNVQFQDRSKGSLITAKSKIQAEKSLTIAADATISGGNGGLQCGAGYIVTNRGVIDLSADSSAAPTYFSLSTTTNEGTIRLGQWASITAGGPFTNSGTVDFEGGPFWAKGYTQRAGTTHFNGGGILNSGVCEFLGGRMEGWGNISNATQLNFGAVEIAPGNGPGWMQWSSAGAVTLGPDTVLQLDLGDPTNSDYIQLSSCPSVVLDGTIDVTAWPGFATGRCIIFKSAGVTTAFTDNGIEVGVMPDGFSATLDYTVPGEVGLVVTPEPMTLSLLAVVGVALRRRQQLRR